MRQGCLLQNVIFSLQDKMVTNGGIPPLATHSEASGFIYSSQLKTVRFLYQSAGVLSAGK